MKVSKDAIKNSAKSLANQAKFQLKDKYPLILTGVAGVTMIGSVVTACKTSRSQEVTDILKEHEIGIYDANLDENIGKAKTKVCIKTGKKLAKTYYKTIILGGVSLGCMTASTTVMRKRNLALAAACTAVEAGFKAYRDGVIDRYGEDIDKELRYGVVQNEVEVKKKDKDGKEVVKKKKVKAIDPNKKSPFAVFYERDCLGWTKDPQANKKFLLKQQGMLNDRLKARGEGGWVTINEVYKSLGIPETPEGMTVGWFYSEKFPVGDNFIDFGIFDMTDANVNFVNGYEPVILLDFNYDGNIQTLAEEYSKKKRGNK